MKALVETLRAEYTELGSGQHGEPPEWAYRLPTGEPLQATIPFVGQAYAESSPRIAVFASAENLAHLGEHPGDFLLDERALDRHRVQREMDRRGNPGGFWPQVGIRPVEDGSLLCAALFVAQVVRQAPPEQTPAGFLEQLVVANVCKFSKQGGVNRDYLGCMRDVRPSLPYLRADLQVTKPEILLIPKTALNNREVGQVVAEVCPSARRLQVPQFNARVVHGRHLATHHARGLELQQELAGTLLGDWMSRLAGYSPGYAYRYLALLEELLG